MARIDELEQVPHGHLGIAVIGDGAEVALVAELQKVGLQAMSLPAVVSKVEDLKADLQKLLDMGYRGVNVGNPYKAGAARLAAHFYIVKHSLGAANALMLDGGVFAQNTEVTAFTKTLQDVPPGTALVLG